MSGTVVFTRRGMLLLAGAGIPACLRRGALWAASDSEFWNKKDPSEWTSEEIDKLATKSPWAKEVMATTPHYTDDSGDMGGPGTGSGTGGGMGGGRMGGTGIPGIGGMGGGGMGGGGMGGGGRRGGRGGQMPMEYHAVVRWESAKPLLDALKTPIPEALAGHYLISVSGVPVIANVRRRYEDGDDDTAVSQGLRPEVLDRIKSMTYLQPKGKSAAQPGVVQPGGGRPGDTNVLVFGFSRELLPLTPDDKEVTFTTQFGRLNLKAKFSLKDMMYHKELAL